MHPSAELGRWTARSARRSGLAATLAETQAHEQRTGSNARACERLRRGPTGNYARVRRRGEVPPEEQRELRARFGQSLWTQRVTASLTQAGLAASAGLSERTIRALEAGTQRPSDATTAKLAAALCPHSDAVTVAKMDLQLQADAGRSLRPRNRRKPPRVSKQRVYEEARRQLADTRATGKPDPVMAYAVALIEPLPTDPWEWARRPAVRT